MSGHGTEERFVIVADARRRRSRAEKEAIVAELLASGSTVSAMARKHNIAPSLLFRWRREFAGKEVPNAEPVRPFVPIALPVIAGSTAQAARPSSADADKARIEIVLAGGRRVLVGPDVDANVLRRVVEALEAG